MYTLVCGTHIHIRTGHTTDETAHRQGGRASEGAARGGARALGSTTQRHQQHSGTVAGYNPVYDLPASPHSKSTKQACGYPTTRCSCRHVGSRQQTNKPRAGVRTRSREGGWDGGGGGLCGTNQGSFGGKLGGWGGAVGGGSGGGDGGGGVGGQRDRLTVLHRVRVDAEEGVRDGDWRSRARRPSRIRLRLNLRPSAPGIMSNCSKLSLMSTLKVASPGIAATPSWRCRWRCWPTGRVRVVLGGCTTFLQQTVGSIPRASADSAIGRRFPGGKRGLYTRCSLVECRETGLA